MNTSYRPFVERGLAAATKKEGSSTTGSWRADRAPTQPSEGAQLSLPVGAFNSQLPELTFRQYGSWKQGSHANMAAPTTPSRCFAKQRRSWSGSSSQISWGRCEHAPPSSASNRSTPLPRLYSPSLLVWSLTLINASPPSRTIAIAVDISKKFDMVSHRLHIEMIHLSRLQHNLIRWLVAWLYQQHHSPSRQLRDLLSRQSPL